MNKLNKKQRHKRYKEALNYHKNLLSNEALALCPLVGYAKHYDELMLFEPERCSGKYVTWFCESTRMDESYKTNEVKEHQRTVLEFCIEMTKP